MKPRHPGAFRIAGSMVLALALLGAGSAWAGDEAPFQIRRFTIDGGGLTPKDQIGIVVRGTIGQPDPGSLAGSTFRLAGGFWGGGGASLDPSIFTDGFETGDTSRWSSSVSLTGPGPTEGGGATALEGTAEGVVVSAPRDLAGGEAPQ